LERRITAINRFTRAGRPTSPSPRARRAIFAISMNGCAAGCGRCAGRNGSSPRHAGKTCPPSALPSAPLANGPGPARDVARRGFVGALPNAHRRLLAPPGPARIHRFLPPSPGCRASRQVRTRMPGGVAVPIEVGERLGLAVRLLQSARWIQRGHDPLSVAAGPKRYARGGRRWRPRRSPFAMAARRHSRSLTPESWRTGASRKPTSAPPQPRILRAARRVGEPGSRR
jgi:hypothetical protein